MKRFRFSYYLLALAILLLPPQTHATQRCLRPTNFCDTISFDTEGRLGYGNWDWECIRDWRFSSIIGAKPGPQFTTRPVYGGDMFAYAVQFSFKPGNLFDLIGTSGMANGLLTFQSDQPFTVTNGTCSGHSANDNKPSLLSTMVRTMDLPQPHSTNSPRCLHFANFCDTIVLLKSGTLAYGNWDWQCKGDWSSTPIIGNAEVGKELATRPGSTYLPFAYSTEFVFKPGKLFDLYATEGYWDGVIVARKDQPYALTDGACGPGDVDLTKPRMTAP